MTDFSRPHKNTEIIQNVEVKSYLQFQLEGKNDIAVGESQKEIENSKSPSASKSVRRSLDNFPLTSSTGKSHPAKFVESRDEISDRVSKYYFQQQTNFARNSEVFELVRENSHPTFSNDPEAEKQRVRSREASNSKTGSRIVTPSKIITKMFERYDSVTKTSHQKESEIAKNQESESETEPMTEFWEVMKKDKTRDIPQESKENLFKSIFHQRAQHLKS